MVQVSGTGGGGKEMQPTGESINKELMGCAGVADLIHGRRGGQLKGIMMQVMKGGRSREGGDETHRKGAAALDATGSKMMKVKGAIWDRMVMRSGEVGATQGNHGAGNEGGEGEGGDGTQREKGWQ